MAGIYIPWKKKNMKVLKSLLQGISKFQSLNVSVAIAVADGYAGVSKTEVLKVTNNDGNFRRFNARFTNKAVPKPVRAKKVPSFLCLHCKY